ncbi:unnamed protein product [Pneumocystis jirovecii]|uniref:Fibronectin type-III domain-containing protein n=1 Tax=Pneumocystis jirovecii TaxID=42068 RepID=L0PB49_PNEJI|nr:unnamed protein product [Pneumocystis jirovecii]
MNNENTRNLQFTVGKTDAGMTILLTSDFYLIEFPSSLLPYDIETGSVLNVSISRNYEAEDKEKNEFKELQTKIYTTFGTKKPTSPVLRVKNVTQTNVVLEWDPIELATTELRDLILYKNGSRLGKIPKATSTTNTKLSGLSLNTEYSFQLVLRTSGGVYSSEPVIVHTHKITDLTGITVCIGELNENDKKELEQILEKIGAKPIQSEVKIDTTHFITSKNSGPEYEKAISMNIPIVTLDYIRECNAKKKNKQQGNNSELIKDQNLQIQNLSKLKTKEIKNVDKSKMNKPNDELIQEFDNPKIDNFTNKTLDEINKSSVKKISSKQITKRKNKNSLKELNTKKATSDQETAPLETTIQSLGIPTNENAEI